MFYFFWGIVLILFVFFFLINHHRKNRIIGKIRSMDLCEKQRLLNELMEPYGFSYLPKEDIITSRLDAWQREFGYCMLFDKTASRFHMVFDCEPIYFDYAGRTWLMEFWKGQYGINTGSEIGIYCADALLTPQQYQSALFHSIPDELMPLMSMELFFNGKPLFWVSQRHWWLTGFCMGQFCHPGDLSTRISIIFPNLQMLQSFTNSLLAAGYDYSQICICNLKISFSFSTPCFPQPRSPFFSRLSQWKNRQLCRLYLSVTSPFSCTLDKLLYLYFFLPYSFRRMLRFQKNRRQKYASQKQGRLSKPHKPSCPS